jgi:diguanylate cyclase (GGDEF)-like protein
MVSSPSTTCNGHATGDKLLVEVARRLSSQCAGQQADLFRLGGDEFALILSDVTTMDILALGENLCSALRAAFTLPDVTIQISGSVGFAVYPEMASSSEELFEHADYALYQGKRAKRGRAILFSSDHNAEIRLGASIEQACGWLILTAS